MGLVRNWEPIIIDLDFLSCWIFVDYRTAAIHCASLILLIACVSNVAISNVCCWFKKKKFLDYFLHTWRNLFICKQSISRSGLEEKFQFFFAPTLNSFEIFFQIYSRMTEISEFCRKNEPCMYRNHKYIWVLFFELFLVEFWKINWKMTLIWRKMFFNPNAFRNFVEKRTMYVSNS